MNNKQLLSVLHPLEGMGLAGLTAGLLSVGDILAQPGDINWTKIGIYFAVAAGTGAFLWLAAYLKASNPALSIAIEKVAEATEQRFNASQQVTPTQAVKAEMTPDLARGTTQAPSDLRSGAKADNSTEDTAPKLPVVPPAL